MTPVQLVANISGLISFGALLVFAIAGNFLLKNTQVSIFGFTLSSNTAYIILGPILVIVNSAIFIFCAMLSLTKIGDGDIVVIQNRQTYWFFGSLFNPFFVSQSNVMNALGYAFLIILWWIGMHCFWYSSRIDAPTPFTQAWSYLIGALYLVVGLMSMLAIQRCWFQLGSGEYRLKQIAGLFGIPIGAALPPILFGLNFPQYATRLWNLIRILLG